MKTLNRTLLVSALVMGGLVCTSTRTLGDLMTFTVDPTESNLSVTSASLSAPYGVNITLMAQALGSLSTDYGGTIEADVTDSSIEFVGGSSIVASNSGSWQPGVGGVAGSAPANYGGKGTVTIPFVDTFTAWVAMRGIAFDAYSGPLAITSGAFPAETVAFEFKTNANSVLDFSHDFPPTGSGTYVFTGLSTNGVGQVGSLVTVSNQLVLEIPVNFTGSATMISTDDLTYTLVGTLVARAPVAASPPEILSLQVNPGQLVFTISTLVGTNYTLLGGTNLMSVSNSVDNFTATGTTTVRTHNKAILQKEFFQVRRN